MKECDLKSLMSEYFANKDEIKRMKRARRDLMIKSNFSIEECKECTWKISEDGDDRVVVLCETCKTIDEYYEAIKKMAEKNRGIINRVRGICRKNIKSDRVG